MPNTAFLRRYGPSLAWLSLITLLSVIPSKAVPGFNLFSFDKIGHAVFYGVLTWLLLRARQPARPLPVAGIALCAIGYGVLMEYVQYAFVPGRFYEYDDMIANALGAGVGVGAWFFRRG